MAISDKIIQLNQVKQEIKQAIEDKGVAMAGVPFTNYPLKINEISGGGGEVDEYFYYSKAYYTITNNSALFENAWEHSLTVDPEEISVDSSDSGGGGGGGGVPSSPRGTAQYPNGETEGVIIPQGVERIGNYAFKVWKSNNQPLVIPNSVTSIGRYAFYNWLSNNQPLVIPDSVTSIGGNAFSYWEANNHPLVIPDGVTSIDNYAFGNWSLVPYIEIQAIIPPTLGGADAFDYQNNAPIYVPDESVDAYKTATNWVSLASRILAVSKKP